MNRKINTEGFDKFFYSFSKWVIFIPIAILAVSLLMTLGQTAKISSKVETAKPVQSNPTPQTGKPAFDFKGPYVCNYKNKDVDVLAYIKNGKALVTIVPKANGLVSQKIFFDGDCLFVDGAKKMCNLKSYIPLFTGMLGGNLASFDSISEQYLKQKVEIGTLLDTCKKEDFEEKILKNH